MAEVDSGGGGGHKKKGGPKGKKKSTRIDMTAMVDMAFLLLTFFILTTTMSDPKLMELNLPPKVEDPTKEENEVKVKEEKVMTFALGKDDKVHYWVGMGEKTSQIMTTDYSDKGLRKIILNHMKAVGDPIFVIKPMPTCRYKNVVDILDEMAITDAPKYAMTDVSSEDSTFLADQGKQ